MFTRHPRRNLSGVNMPDQKEVRLFRIERPLDGHPGKYAEICQCEEVEATVSVVRALLATGDSKIQELRISRVLEMRLT